MIWTGLHLFPTVALLISIGLGAVVFRYREFSGRIPMILMLLAAGEWSLGAYFELSANSLEGKIFWDNIQFLGYSLILPGILLFVLSYTKLRLPKLHYVLPVLAIEPLVTNILAWTNEASHNLIRVNPRIELFDYFSLLHYDWGGWLWVSTLYAILLYTASLVLLARHIFTTRLHQERRPWAVFWGLLIPWIGAIMLMVGLIPDRVDVSPLFFALGFGVVAWGIFREELFPLSTATYKSIVENQPHGIVLLDPQHRIVRLNAAAVALLDIGEESAFGKRFQEILGMDTPIGTLEGTGHPCEQIISIATTTENRYYHLRSKAVRLSGRRGTGTLVFIDDVTERSLSEKKLRRSTERFNNLGHYLADRVLFFAYTPDGIMTYLSEGARRLGPLTPEEAVGKHAGEITDWTPESIPVERDHRQKLVCGEEDSANFVLSFTAPEGTTRYMSFYEYPIRNEQTGALTIEGVGIDVTREKETERELTTLGLAIENAQVTVVVTDAEATITYVNPFFEALTGYSRQEAVGHTPGILKSGYHNSAFYKEMWTTLMNGGTWRGELKNRKKDGSLYWERAIISPIFDENGTIIQYVGVKEDITDRKQLEKLREEVERITRHDIRSPLNAIIGLPEIMLQDSNLSEEQKEDLSLISYSGRNVLEAMNLSVTLLSIESGSYDYKPEPLDLAIMVKQCAKEQKVAAAAKGVETTIAAQGFDSPEAEHIMVSSDRLLAYSVISNLLKNAVEASPEHETVTVEFVQGEPIALSIHNKGVVPADIRDSFFEKYKTSGKKGGKGIGTYSAKTFAEAQGWTIAMESREPEGTTLTLGVPPAY